MRLPFEDQAALRRQKLYPRAISIERRVNPAEEVLGLDRAELARARREHAQFDARVSPNHVHQVDLAAAGVKQ